jgi:hypothetical protein
MIAEGRLIASELHRNTLYQMVLWLWIVMEGQRTNAIPRRETVPIARNLPKFRVVMADD